MFSILSLIMTLLRFCQMVIDMTSPRILTVTDMVFCCEEKQHRYFQINPHDREKLKRKVVKFVLNLVLSALFLCIYNMVDNTMDFLPSFKIFWEKIIKFRQNYQDIADWWDMLAKPEIKDFCIGFSIQRRVRREHTKKLLLSYLKLALERKD